MGRVYDLQEWHRVRRHVLTEHPLCQHCEARGVIRPAHHVDHITPISKGGAWFDAENLQALCHDCHNRKTAADEGKRVQLGCGADGQPMDATHPWNR